MIESLNITLPPPPRELSPNHTIGSRGARLGKAMKVKQYRQSACYHALSAMGRTTPPRWERATARAVFYCATKRRRDADNALGSLKAAFDGLRDAGVIADDSGLTHEPVVFAVDRERPRVEISVRPTV